MARILVVEDEPDIALGLKLDLSNEGYSVQTESDGIAASRIARSSEWDLIILDVMLPGRDGFEICRDVRQAGITSPILMLTARAHEAEKVMGLDTGADDYVVKPFSPRELRARVRALLRRAPSAPGSLERLGSCEIDFSRGQVRRDDRVTDLTAIEFKLLQMLVRNAGRIVSRQQVIDAVWGSEVFVTARVVDTHVMKLRRKVEPDPEAPRHIVSVRGLGYRLDA
jgi:DNA-binding response OmpR family regulator